MRKKMVDRVVIKVLGPRATSALRRSKDYAKLSPEDQWVEDKRLGILDWDGDPDN